VRRVQTMAEPHPRDDEAAPDPTPRRRRPGRVLVPSVVAGVVALLLTAAAGTAYALQRPVEWTASSTLLLTPQVETDGTVASSYYDTLSNGQLPSTAAAIVRDPSLLRATAERLGIDPGELDTRVVVVPETAVIEIEVTATDAETAIAVADGVAEAAVPEVNELLAPYALSPLGDAGGTAEATSLSRAQWQAIVALAAIVVGVAVQQTVHQLLRARPRRQD
jgi:capsular polysaccharide biosynthesis protein